MGRAQNVEYEILGALCLYIDGVKFPLSGNRSRTLLAMLLLDYGDIVPADRLIDALWGESPPKYPRNLLQVCVSRLRGRLEAAGASRETIATEPAGYRIATGSLDLLEYRRLCDEARAAANGHPDKACALFRSALALWRGPALHGIDSDVVCQAANALEEERLLAVEECIDSELAAGHAGRLVGELTSLVEQHPFRERLRGALMLALYREGRQADALEAFRRMRQILHEELGAEPGHRLQRLHKAILHRDPELNESRTLPPPLSMFPTPRELPADVVGFTGREAVLRELGGLSNAGPRRAPHATVIVIAGPAGVGKTALAVHWAHRTADHFPDGQLFLNLSGHATGPQLRPTEALAALLRSLGMPPEQIPADEQEAARLYRSQLADRQLLVVLDNVGSADQVRPLLPGMGICTVVITSRDRLTGLVALDGARRITLDVLRPDEASTLLIGQLSPKRVHAEPDAVAALARACAYLPLALRVAAANLANNSDGLTISAYLAELSVGDRLTLLANEGDEERSVWAAQDLSYRRLSAEAQRMFRLLGLVPGADFTPAAAAALAGITIGMAEEILARLASANLVEEHHLRRFTFHDLLRLHARERAQRDESEQGRADAAKRLFWWYTSGAAAAADLLYPDMPRLPTSAGAEEAPHQRFRRPAEALAWLNAERTNLVAAIRHAATDGPRPFAWLLTSCLYGYFWHQRYATAWLQAAEAALSAAEEGHEFAAQAAMKWSLSGAHRALGRSSEAAENLTSAVSLAHRSNCDDIEGYALTNLGMVYAVAGRFEKASRCLKQALRLAQRSGQHALEAQVFGNLGFLSRQTGRLRQAAGYCAQQLAVNRQIYPTDNHNTARSLSNLACVETKLGLLDAAHEKLAVALALHRRAGRRLGEVNVLLALADGRLDAGEIHRAYELAQAALSLARQINDPRKEAEARQVLGDVYVRMGKSSEAADCYQHVLEMARRTDDSSSHFLAVHGLASVKRNFGQYTEAAEYALEAWGLAKRTGHRLFDGIAMTTLGEIRLIQGRYDEAGSLAQDALNCHRESGYRLGEARTLAVLGSVQDAVEGSEAAQQYWRAASELFTDIGAPLPEGLFRDVHNRSPRWRAAADT